MPYFRDADPAYILNLKNTDYPFSDEDDSDTIQTMFTPNHIMIPFLQCA